MDNSSADDDSRYVLEHYDPGVEGERLTTPVGSVEFERTKEELTTYLPPPPATVADIGGGPGRYALWLAETGYRVVHRDLVPAHVDELRGAASARGLVIDTAVNDARDLSLPDASADPVLLLGPLYHLSARTDRLRALREARRILPTGGMAFIAAISRWAPRLQAVVVERLYDRFGVEVLRDELSRVERAGRMPPLQPKGFAGFLHRPDQLRREVVDAGFRCLSLVGLEGISFALADLEERLASPDDREVVMEAVRRTARVPELLGLSPHILVIAEGANARSDHGARATGPSGEVAPHASSATEPG
jgi:SAM-dependent methyltransferase